MKTFKQFIAEGQAPVDDDAALTLIEALKQSCGPFLKQSGIKPLWRGMPTEPKDYEYVTISGEEVPLYKKWVRQDRKPLSTTVKMHKVIDDYFFEKFNVRARSQGIFCYGEEGRKYTEEFGSLYAVFPIGEFKYVWSPKVKDLTYALGNLTSAELKAIDPEVIGKFLDGKKYKMNGLKAALNTDCEISVICSSFYAVRISDEQEYEELMKELK
jgi:hypothetical protein